MNDVTPAEPDEIFKRSMDSIYAGSDVPAEFMSLEPDERISILRHAFTSIREIGAALYVMRHLSAHELLPLFDLLITFSLSHGLAGAVREIIVRMPRKWVLKNIEEEAEKHLAEGTYDEYRRFLELYVLLDKDLTGRLVERALNHPDEDVREAGEDFQQILLSEE